MAPRCCSATSARRKSTLSTCNCPDAAGPPAGQAPGRQQLSYGRVHPQPDADPRTGVRHWARRRPIQAKIMDYVKGSFAALHRAMAVINERNMLEPMAAFPSLRQKTRLQLAVDVVGHS